jgi:tellurite resistance protein
MKKNKTCRLKHFNISFFAAVIWFCWLSIASHKLIDVYHINSHFSKYILYFTLILFSIITLLYIIKAFINFKDVKEDFKHPVRSSFFPWIWKILLLFAIWFLTIDKWISNIFWISWVIFQSIFTIILFRRWMLHEIDIKSMNPLWFLPIVWNMIAPIAWFKLWYIELSWFFFSIWIIMWFVLFTIIMNRIIFHNPIAQKLMPTLFILIAPPAIWFISFTTLNNGELMQFWKILYYFSLFMFIIIISKINILKKIKFYLSWWAYSFPMAAITIATILYYHLTGIMFFFCLWIFFYLILCFIILLLIYKTIIWIKNKNLCIEEV